MESNNYKFGTSIRWEEWVAKLCFISTYLGEMFTSRIHGFKFLSSMTSNPNSSWQQDLPLTQSLTYTVNYYNMYLLRTCIFSRPVTAGSDLKQSSSFIACTYAIISSYAMMVLMTRHFIACHTASVSMPILVFM